MVAALAAAAVLYFSGETADVKVAFVKAKRKDNDVVEEPGVVIPQVIEPRENCDLS
jgi:hypothetical protein